MSNKHLYKISDSFVNFLIETSNGFVSIDLLEELFSSIENEAKNYHFTLSSEANLIRIISAVFNSKLFLRELIQYPHHLEITIAIAASSNYLTDISVRNPEFLYQFFSKDYLKKQISIESLSKETADINHKFKTFNSKINVLRNLKSKSILAIGLRDILGFATLEETVTKLSVTASAVLSSLFDISYRTVLKKYDINSTRRKYCLASLGKLGGRELNYSSDVDLILFFDRNAKIGNAVKVEYYQVLNEAVQLFIKNASELTANGFLYRIDFRLRPEGRNAPLCRTIADFERYYETRGEDWERQMLIKLDFLCGSKTLFNSFQSYIHYFVYPSSFSTSPVEQIKKMKRNIELNLSKDSNIKLFSGGIRDIEFAVQALQLLNGGSNKELRTGTTLIAIKQLFKYNFLNKNEAEMLKNAYAFYRKIEHFLQLLNDTQTHSIPDDRKIMAMLIKCLSVPSIKIFQISLNRHRKNVRKIFNDITGLKATNSTQINFNFEIFQNKQRAKSNYQYLAEGSDLTGQNKLDSKTMEIFQLLTPILQSYFQKSKRPDRVLENFTKFTRSVKIISIWYREFLDDKFFKKILTICEYSSYSIELQSSQKGLAELVLSRKVFIKNIETQFASLSIHDILLVLSIQYTLRLVNSAKLSVILYKYIKFKISKNSILLNMNVKYFIAGLGSFGTKSMGFKSDIDLIFVVENLDNYEFIQTQFQKLLNDIKTELPMFEVDCRLRPEGNKSPLVWDLKNYKDYLTNRARVWEFQSLLKASFVCGDEKLFADFSKFIITKLNCIYLEDVRNEMLSMIKSLRGKHNSIFLGTIDIKNGWGGLTYINFIVSFALFENPISADKLNGKSLLDKIKYFCKYDMRKELFIQLKDNFVFLKTVELALQICLNKRNSVLPKEDNDLKLIANFLGIADEKQFVSKISQVSKSNNEIFEQVLNGKD